MHILDAKQTRTASVHISAARIVNGELSYAEAAVSRCRTLIAVSDVKSEWCLTRTPVQFGPYSARIGHAPEKKTDAAGNMLNRRKRMGDRLSLQSAAVW